MTKEALTSQQESGTLTALNRVGGWIGGQVQAVRNWSDQQAQARYDAGEAGTVRATVVYPSANIDPDKTGQTLPEVYLALDAMYVVPTKP